VAPKHPQDIKLRTFEFAKRVVKLCQVLESQPGVSRTLSSQLLRSGTSIGANVEEAHGGQSKADFTAKMYIACKEARSCYILDQTFDLHFLSFQNARTLPAEDQRIE
jgi:four helix bundle protein